MDEDEKPEPKIVTTSHIKNKIRRGEVHGKQKKEKAKLKREKQKKIKKAIAAGEEVKKQVPKTLESTREPDETLVDPEDKEIVLDQETDELSSYFNRESPPKVIITCNESPHDWTLRFCRELRMLIQDSIFLHRKHISLKKLVKDAHERNFTNIVVINEDRRHPASMLVIHLPDGPTALFKISGIKHRKHIENCASVSKHKPEIIMNNFKSRLGLSIGRLMSSLFQFDPEFQGRRVVTCHNQRDFIFVRHHRYEFKSEKKVALQEIGPRFTLRLRSLQKSTFDSKYGEYEWILKRHEMQTSRRKFFL